MGIPNLSKRKVDMLRYVEPKKVAFIKYVVAMLLLALICAYVIFKSYVRQFDSGFYFFCFSAIANYVYADRCYKNYKQLAKTS